MGPTKVGSRSLDKRGSVQLAVLNLKPKEKIFQNWDLEVAFLRGCFSIIYTICEGTQWGWFGNTQRRGQMGTNCYCQGKVTPAGIANKTEEVSPLVFLQPTGLLVPLGRIWYGNCWQRREIVTESQPPIRNPQAGDGRVGVELREIRLMTAQIFLPSFTVIKYS